MSEVCMDKTESVKIGLLGASFDTGNMGVNALAESSIKCILHYWPEAEITLIACSRVEEKVSQKIHDREIALTKIPVRFCKNIFLDNHFIVLCFYAFLFKIIKMSRFREFCRRRNAALRSIDEIRFAADITGGDSFSDIYGMKRFVMDFCVKWLMLFFGKDLIMLPQTYGPFKRPLTRLMAGYIVRRAKVVYSRDKDGVECANHFLDEKDWGKVKLCPDVAFVLDPRKPSKIDVGGLEDVRSDESMIVGLNVSGLLYNGGYTQNNMFGLKVNYPELIVDIVEELMSDEKVLILLVPHVFPNKGHSVESDPVACRKIYESLSSKWSKRLFLVEGEYDQAEIKYIIGKCDFFIGSRMHSCIAALSQKVPTIGLAYSKKFKGVFDTIGIADNVVDACSSNSEDILKQIAFKVDNKNLIREHLERNISDIQTKVLDIFSSNSIC